MSIVDSYSVQSVRNNIDVINRSRDKEDKVLKKAGLVKLSVENFHQKQRYSTNHERSKEYAAQHNLYNLDKMIHA